MMVIKTNIFYHICTRVNITTAKSPRSKVWREQPSTLPPPSTAMTHKPPKRRARRQRLCAIFETMNRRR